MKKGGKPPRQQISKQAFQIAKTTVTPNNDGNKSKLLEPLPKRPVADSTTEVKSHNEEEEIMGESGKGNKRSGAMEKNLNQMVKVLHSRLKSLEDTATTRLKLCEEDLMPNSTKMSKLAPKILDEYDEAMIIAKSNTKEINKAMNSSHKDTTGNLVTSDTVYIDPYHLVVKTKVLTEAGKQIEGNIDKNYGTLNLRDIKSKKTKILNQQSDKSKKSEQLKNEAKRINRMKIEKKLQNNMESFVTRSVMDQELIFRCPEKINEEAIWPVTIKWSARDPRCTKPENNDGEFDPDLLLRYALERITLPSGKKLFAWLIRQPMIQRYFVSIFWLIKVKFFDSERTEDIDAYLLRLMSVEYRRIVELLANRTHAEHEKDFAFKFLPFILTNGVYFAFYYVFPGSRHIYTKAFKKTIYMQIIQLMHGFQVCPSTVKVAWTKLFPEDYHDDGDEGEDGGETFPVVLALKEPKFVKSASAPEFQEELKSSSIFSRHSIALLSAKQSTIMSEESKKMNNPKDRLIRRFPTKYQPSAASGPRPKSGFIAEDDFLQSQSTSRPTTANKPKTGRFREIVQSGLQNRDSPLRASMLSVASTSFDMMGIGTKSGSPKNNSSKRRSMDFTQGHMNKQASTQSMFEGASSMGFIKAQNKINTEEFFENPKIQESLSKTYLKPPREKPGNVKHMVKRQTNIEPVIAKELSPQMQLFLSSMQSNHGTTTTLATQQTLRRTVPINWCPAGGTDTYHKTTVDTDLHSKFSTQLKKSREEFQQQNHAFHLEKIRSRREVEHTLEQIMGSGPTTISRYSLDLIRRQRSNPRGQGAGTGAPDSSVAQLEGVSFSETAQLAQFDDAELDRFIAEL